MTRLILALLIILTTPFQTMGAEPTCRREAAVKEGKPYFPTWQGRDYFVQDAIRRWKTKSGNPEHALDGRVPMHLNFQDEVCVQLLSVETDPSSGPIYCYEFWKRSRTRTFDKAVPAPPQAAKARPWCQGEPDKDDDRPYFPVANADQPLVDDAIGRWKILLKESAARDMEIRIPIVMAFPDETCVQLIMSVNGIGGEPTYCYDKIRGRLTRKNDQVE